MYEVTPEDIDRVLTVAMHLAPTGKEQRGFAALSNQPFPSNRDRLIAIMDAIADGTRYNNWPTA